MIALSFVELTVFDVARAVAWYQQVLGLAVVLPPDNNGFALLRTGSIQLALKQGSPQASGVLLAFEVSDLDGWMRRLLGQKADVQGEIKTSAEGYRRIRVRDGDGYAVTLFEWLAKNNNGTDE